MENPGVRLFIVDCDDVIRCLPAGFFWEVLIFLGIAPCFQVLSRQENINSTLFEKIGTSTKCIVDKDKTLYSKF